MKAQDQYLRFVRWEEADGTYVGFCPDLFPWGGVCHATTEEEAYRQLSALVAEEVEQLQREGKPLPAASTRPMRDAVPA
ncbi:MAG: type II toxin-antitoxin system HicB family antitoxin [Verrucomicrobia bacterium]|nr:type II toxin-antitoxin system HicB family antitoxin [Verrucomicrobiota bacterium]